MRPRLIGGVQLVTVRRLLPQEGDEFGDAKPEQHRDVAVQVRMQISYNRRETSIGGAPGRDIGVAAIALVNKAECEAKGWTPTADDLVQFADGESLFVRDASPETAKAIRVGTPSGGWKEWRLTLTSSAPAQRAATVYDA